jgi:putative (di)nucleoside polyphosphate hydrolase
MTIKPHYRPGVGMMLVNPKKQVWVGERINAANSWQMPQGGIDANEDPRSAMFRELLEETGISENDVTIIAESKEWLSFDWPLRLQKVLWDGLYLGQCQKWYLLRLETLHDVTNLDVEHPEFSAHQWVDVNVLTDLVIDFKRDMYEKIITEFEWYFK